MYARVTRAAGKPENMKQVVEAFRDAAIQDQPGWKGGYVMIEPNTGKLLTITLWESTEAMERSAGMARQIWGEASSMAGAGQPSVEAYEIALQPGSIEAGTATHARVSTIMARPDSIDRTIDFLRKSMTGDEQGWRGAWALVDRRTGKMLTATLWDSRKAIQDTSTAADRIREMAVTIAGAEEPTVEIFEVALQPTPVQISSMAG